MARLKTAANALLRYGGSPSLAERRQHNTLTSVNRLPEELLTKIFFLCARPDIPRGSDDWSWVVLSHICFAWRQAALKAHEIWRFIDFSHPKWTALTLRRGKMSPLHIRAAVDDGNISQIRRTLHLAHRIEEVHLTSSQNIYPLFEVLANPNPALRSLIVDVNLPVQQTGALYNCPLFATNAYPLPNLLYVELRGAPFYLLSSRHANLKHLHLHDFIMPLRPTRQQFLSLLFRLSRLETLTLDDAFPLSSPSRSKLHLIDRVTLPYLAQLTLKGRIEEVADMLDSLLFPPTTHLVITITNLNNRAGGLHRLSQAISIHSWSAAIVTPLEHLVVTFNQSSSPRFTQDDALNDSFQQSLRILAYTSSRTSYPSPAFDFTLLPDAQTTDDSVTIAVLTNIWKALALAHVHTLAVQSLDIITQGAWTELLRALPSLRVLRLSGHAPAGLAWALYLNARAQSMRLEDGEDAQRILVPRLVDVYMRDIDCCSGGYMVSSSPLSSPPSLPDVVRVNSHGDLDDSRFLDVVVAWLKERCRFGGMIRSLSVSRCGYVIRRSMDEARTCVEYLVWDSKGVVKEEEMDRVSPARYRTIPGQDAGKVRHYHRLRALNNLY